MTTTVLELNVSGMICRACEDAIADALLHTRGVVSAQAHYWRGRVTITYDPNIVTEDTLRQVLTNAGYPPGTHGMGGVVVDGICLALVGVLYWGLPKLLALVKVPALADNAPLGLVFLVGLLTSTHCIGMCGGILLAQTTDARGVTGRSKRGLITSAAYNGGRVGSYTAVGALCGAWNGFLVAKMIMSRDGTMGTYFDMPYWSLKLPGFCLAILICLILALTLIGYLSVKEMLRGTAADSLRPYAPKKMKKLLLEKTALWNRFSFGTRWNLRDVMRHKSRTLMSLVGIVGCMVIVVGTMGMRDTMNAFLSIYYDDSMKYSSRIYLSETATEEETQKIIDAYKGDSSATVSVQTDDKAVALDIYDITHGKVRFPAEKDGYVTPAKDGAYICMRIADEFDLAAGDTLTARIKPTNLKLRALSARFRRI